MPAANHLSSCTVSENLSRACVSWVQQFCDCFQTLVPSGRCTPVQVLAYVCEQRPDFIDGGGGGLAAAWEALVGASGSANSAARRFRLRCLKAVVLLLLDEETEVEALLSAPADDGASPNEQRQQVYPGPTDWHGMQRMCCVLMSQMV